MYGCLVGWSSKSKKDVVLRDLQHSIYTNIDHEVVSMCMYVHPETFQFFVDNYREHMILFADTARSEVPNLRFDYTVYVSDKVPRNHLWLASGGEGGRDQSDYIERTE